jgi:hypothetical protein
VGVHVVDVFLSTQSTSLLPNFQEQRFHQAVVARLKRGLLASEQKTERFRQEKKRMRKQIEEGTIQNFSLSSLREAPVEAQLSRLSFEELQQSNTDADYVNFDFVEMLESRRILEFATVPFDERKLSTMQSSLLPGQATSVEYSGVSGSEAAAGI